MTICHDCWSPKFAVSAFATRPRDRLTRRLRVLAALVGVFVGTSLFDALDRVNAGTIQQAPPTWTPTNRPAHGDTLIWIPAPVVSGTWQFEQGLGGLAPPIVLSGTETDSQAQLKALTPLKDWNGANNTLPFTDPDTGRKGVYLRQSPKKVKVKATPRIKKPSIEMGPASPPPPPPPAPAPAPSTTPSTPKLKGEISISGASGFDSNGSLALFEGGFLVDGNPLSFSVYASDTTSLMAGIYSQLLTQVSEPSSLSLRSNTLEFVFPDNVYGGVFLDGSDTTANLPKTTEVRVALRCFRV